MMQITTPEKIMLLRDPTDMRKSFDGLSGIIRNQLKGDPTDGTLFLFINRRRDRIKAMYWDRDGLALWYKRLESGTFETLRLGSDAFVVQIDATEFAMLLGGAPWRTTGRRKRYQKSA